MQSDRGLLCPWSVRWWFSPDLDLLLEQDAVEKEHLKYLEYLEEAEELHKQKLLAQWHASTCMAWDSF